MTQAFHWMPRGDVACVHDPALARRLQHELDRKTKPRGALGRLEDLALQLGLIQRTLRPRLLAPTLVVFAGDHGITAERVSSYPAEVTRQMVRNFLDGGAAANVLAREAGMELVVADAGVAGELPEAPGLLTVKVAPGTANFAAGPAMSEEQCLTALCRGEEIVERLWQKGCNALAAGEMGIGNTSSAACLMAVLCGEPVEACVGRGTGLHDAGLAHKVEVLRRAVDAYRSGPDPMQVLRHFGGYEVVMMTGAFLAGAARRMVLLVDGFIATAAMLAASRLAPHVVGYAVFCHRSAEQAHGRLLARLGAEPLLDLGLRLGEGTGAALAMPIVRSAVALLNDMASFKSAGISGPDSGDA
jgi:nicotinate-nucleotide--dimethylbenzimidazole phosphoribosyltransferase